MIELCLLTDGVQHFDGLRNYVDVLFSSLGSGSGSDSGSGAHSFYLPNVSHDGDFEFLEQFITPSVGATPTPTPTPTPRLVTSNLSLTSSALNVGATVEIGSTFGVFNSRSVNALANMGVSKIWLSHELSLPEISQLTKNTEMPFGIVVSGRTELMTMKHCLLPAKNNCKRNCQACPHRKKRFISKTGWHTNFQ